MTVVVLSNCPPRLRGDLTKWMIEVNTNVYVGQFSARVRNELWNRICENVKSGQATMVFSVNGEQKMDFRVHNTVLEPTDFDGIKLMLHPSMEYLEGKSSLPPRSACAPFRPRTKRSKPSGSRLPSSEITIWIPASWLAAYFGILRISSLAHLPRISPLTPLGLTGRCGIAS